MVWRWAVGGVAVTFLVAAAVLVVREDEQQSAPLPEPPPAQTIATVLEPPQATEATREEKRFRRYDRDRNASVSREEYLRSRRQSFTRFDTNGDGVLSFDEYAVKQNERFDDADADGSGELVAAEFEKTRTVRVAAQPKVDCEAS